MILATLSVVARKGLALQLLGLFFSLSLSLYLSARDCSFVEYWQAPNMFPCLNQLLEIMHFCCFVILVPCFVALSRPQMLCSFIAVCFASPSTIYSGTIEEAGLNDRVRHFTARIPEHILLFYQGPAAFVQLIPRLGIGAVLSPLWLFFSLLLDRCPCTSAR